MTSQAVVKKSDLDRMAQVANERNTVVEYQRANGDIIRVMPAATVSVEKKLLAPKGGVRL
jgi:hypothetical protein